MPIDRKERPNCRRQIEKIGCVPYIQNGIWDGMTLQFPDDEPESNRAGLFEIYRLSDGMRKQFHQMVDEGRFGKFKTVRARRYRNTNGYLVDTYSLDTLRHVASGHQYPFGRCEQCAGVRLNKFRAKASGVSPQ